MYLCLVLKCRWYCIKLSSVKDCVKPTKYGKVREIESQSGTEDLLVPFLDWVPCKLIGVSQSLHSDKANKSGDAPRYL